MGQPLLGFVLVHKHTKLYVAKPGRERSYTASLEDADIFATRKLAEQYQCIDSEDIVPLAEVLMPPRDM